MPITGHELFVKIQAALGPEARRHRGVDPPGRRDLAIAGGSYRAVGALVDGYRAGDADVPVAGVVVAARASTAVLERAVELGANIIITRSAFLGDSQDRPVAKPEPALAAKLDFIDRHGLAVLRLQDPREGPAGLAVTTAFPRALGLETPEQTANTAAGLIYRNSPYRVIDVVRRVKEILPTQTVRLVGDPSLAVSGIAVATETNRPNALAPLISRSDVDLLICGEVHETETTAYVMDAISLGQRKAMLVVGSIAMEEPAARILAQQLDSLLDVSVAYVPSNEGLREVV
ncbi:Nif3-like dinuclear metal center hexameric protein [Altererythrobacter sp. Root672]|uniref:Nif3-like dinuclear metal center hexameric protein n=1 Tax=Altererythrobacter sp. Root672 TaxID=1736584 RepID=UPI00138F2E38|nr:Nif3-like dinuclear metal center hexameric protein [Altererythrobacter sp. Root672]